MKMVCLEALLAMLGSSGFVKLLLINYRSNFAVHFEFIFSKAFVVMEREILPYIRDAHPFGPEAKCENSPSPISEEDEC